MNISRIMNGITEDIRKTAIATLHGDGEAILFGSRARGDWHNESDWDVLVLLNKNELNTDDHNAYTYPFWELGWKTGAMIHPLLYTRKQWQNRKGTAFYNNVETEGIRL